MCCGREWIQPGELVQGWRWDGVLLDGPRVSLKSGFQLNPWLSSKRTRKMTGVHDMARSPRPAKPFHFSLFVSMQLLIFMITPPNITPTSGLPPPNPIAKRKKIWMGLENKDGREDSRSQTPRFHCSMQLRILEVRPNRKIRWKWSKQKR